LAHAGSFLRIPTEPVFIKATKAFMCPIRFLLDMAKGWRGFLEEESEFQWIAMAGFLAFILLGAVAIQGTSTLPGVESGTGDSTHAGKRVLDIDYSTDDAFTAKVLTENGIDLYQQYDANTVVKIMSAQNGLPADDINFITTLHDGNTLISPSRNTIQIIHNPVNEGTGTTQISTLEMDTANGNFTVLELGEAVQETTSSWMMVTQDGTTTSLRGFGNIGKASSSSTTLSEGMAASILSAPMANAAGVVWQQVAPLGDNQWAASGYLSYSSDEAGASPASPKIVPTVAVVAWNGGVQAPTITTIHTGNGGIYHSLLVMGDSSVFAAGNQGSTHVSPDGEMIHHAESSVAAVVDQDDRVWLFGDVGSKTIVRYTGQESELVSMPQAITFQVETSGVGDQQIFLHGTDVNGEAQILTIDTSAPGSIESGRGFLNFMFLALFSIVLLVMAWTAGSRLLAAQRY
jgi:hypothetical protein